MDPRLNRLRRRNARSIAWIALLAGVLSFVLPRLTVGIGTLFAIGGHLALATLFLGILAVVLNRNVSRPRPLEPIVSLVFGILVVAIHVWIMAGLADLAKVN